MCTYKLNFSVKCAYSILRPQVSVFEKTGELGDKATQKVELLNQVCIIYSLVQPLSALKFRGEPRDKIVSRASLSQFFRRRGWRVRLETRLHIIIDFAAPSLSQTHLKLRYLSY